MASKNKQSIKFEADVSSFKNNVKDAEKSITSLNATLKLNKTQLAGNSESTQLLSQRLETLKQKYDQQSIAIENTKKSYDKAVEYLGENSKEAEQLSKKLVELQTAQQKTSNEIQSTNKELEKQAKNFETNGKKITEWGEGVSYVGDKVDKLGNKLSVLSAGVAAVGLSSIKAATSFESAWTGVTKTVDGTEKQMNELKKGILDLTKKIPSTAEEISAVAESAGQLGIQTDNVLAFTKTMIDMGNATNLSADEAATTLARFANVTKMSQTDFDRLGSVIVDLGNKFATTEAEIAQMGMNLASAGTQVGMSQAEIMGLATALSSVGLEAQAGGTAFSKVMINMQLAVERGGSDLKDFASVAGMTSKEFKEAFEEDATTAIMKFVDGLSKSGEQGKSAIKILDDMGIKETRLRDSLLRSANASEIMEKAIKLGNKAWKENNALVNEANKRYETTESKFQINKNKIKEQAITIGNKLLPEVNKILEKTGKWIDELDKLSDEQKETIINIGLVVAAAGPLIKVGGTAITTIGGVAKGIGTLSQAIGVMKTGTESANSAANTLANGLSGIVSPAGAAVAGVALFTAAVAATKVNVDKQYESLTKLTEELKNNSETRKNAIETIDKQSEAQLAEINNTENLRKELESLVDENGRVKEGYEGRTNFILGELNNALGTEYSMTDNIIDNYEDLISTIDDLMLKKKAQIKLEADEDKYREAIKNKDQLYKDLIKTEEEINKIRQRAKEIQEDVFSVFSDQSSVYNAIEMQKLKEELDKLTETYKEQKDTLEDYQSAINTFETNSELMLEGGIENYKKIEESIATTQQNITKLANAGLNERLQAQIDANIQSEKEYALEVQLNEDAKNSIYATNVQKGEENLKLLTEELKSKTSTIEDLGEEEINAWKTLGDRAYGVYSLVISEMPPEMQRKIEEATGIIAWSTPKMADKAEELGRKTVEEFDKSADAKEKALNVITGYMNGLTDEQKRELLEKAGIENVDIVLEELDRGDLSEENGRNILEGLWKGLKNNTWQGKIVGAASRISAGC